MFRRGPMLVGMTLAMLLVTGVAPAGASGPPVTGGGEGFITGLEVEVIRDVGGNRTERRVVTAQVAGTLTGVIVQEVVGTVHRDVRVNFRGQATFVGTIEGCGEPGAVQTLTLGVTGRGDIPEPGFPVTSAAVRPVGGPSANTVQLTGVGTVDQVGPALSYDLRFVCHE
jgi:hypothetical protein